MKRNRLAITSIMLMLSLLNYSRIKGNEDVRAILFLSIFSMGILAGIIILQVAQMIKNKNTDQNS
jgi:general stress protein CsbA